MAELNTHQTRQQGGARMVKRSTRVDLTPMVDLGFLLITFFIFTAAIARPTSMKLYLPAGTIQDLPTGQSTALTIIPVSHNRFFYYHGVWTDAISRQQYGMVNMAALRELIQLKQQALDISTKFSRKDLMLIIKPAADASYGNLVNVLDEVLINDVKHYALVDMEQVKKNYLAMRPGK